MILTGQGDVDGAMARYQKALEIQPDNVLAQYNLGVIHYRRNEWQPALERTARAIALDPKFKPAYVFRALARAKLGDLNGALGDNNTAITLDPSFILAYINRAEIFMDQGNYAAAIDDCSRILSLASAPSDIGYAHALRGDAYAKLGQKQQAREDFQKALAVAPNQQIAKDGLASLGT